MSEIVRTDKWQTCLSTIKAVVRFRRLIVVVLEEDIESQVGPRLSNVFKLTTYEDHKYINHKKTNQYLAIDGDCVKCQPLKDHDFGQTFVLTITVYTGRYISHGRGTVMIRTIKSKHASETSRYICADQEDMMDGVEVQRLNSQEEQVLPTDTDPRYFYTGSSKRGFLYFESTVMPGRYLAVDPRDFKVYLKQTNSEDDDVHFEQETVV